MSRTKLSHLMDAETWMDAHTAIDMGFADEILTRPAEIPVENNIAPYAFLSCICDQLSYG